MQMLSSTTAPTDVEEDDQCFFDHPLYAFLVDVVHNQKQHKC